MRPDILRVSVQFVLYCIIAWLMMIALLTAVKMFSISNGLTILLPLMTIVPFFTVRFVAKHFVAIHQDRPTFATIAMFAVPAFILCSLSAYVLEALVFVIVGGAALNLGFTEVIFAPLTERYNIGMIGGLSIWSQTSIIAAVALGLRFPAFAFALSRGRFGDTNS